ncbi:hypothetical protein [Telluribacter sp. SYSU D00476]|uniref:hypothetical protein n=1 Tax=Telluribacter sp. SYSU D00476 TaxID=2811430 RepID=UPI001FF10268|nr:hypothetical protein [Telluribacter sp. SYSU D00476]
MAHKSPETDNPSDIYGCLEYIMASKGLTAYALSKELGFDKPAKLYTILRRKTKPSYETLISIVNRFDDINGDWLLRGSGEPFKSRQSHPANKSAESTSQADSAAPSNEVIVLRERNNMLERQLSDRDDTIQLLKQQIMILREVIHREPGNLTAL